MPTTPPRLRMLILSPVARAAGRCPEHPNNAFLRPTAPAMTSPRLTCEKRPGGAGGGLEEADLVEPGDVGSRREALGPGLLPGGRELRESLVRLDDRRRGGSLERDAALQAEDRVPGGEPPADPERFGDRLE